MKRNPRTLLQVLSAALLTVTNAGHAQTVISGPSIMTTTWTPAGSPYIVTADCTVPAGQTLTILPGTTVWMGTGTSLTGNGVIDAVGTAAQRIVFQPPIRSQSWNSLRINNTIGTNRFTYCEFSGATNALDFGQALSSGAGGLNEVSACTFSDSRAGLVFRVSSVNRANSCEFRNLEWGIYLTVGGDASPAYATRTQKSSIEGCVFTNCFSAIYGEAVGTAGRACAGTSCFNWSQDGRIESEVRHCLMVGVAYGCRFHLAGYGFSIPQQGGATGYGYGQVKILNNLFWNVTNTAVSFGIGSFPGGGSASLVNNDVINAGSGVATQDPWNTTIQNNILKSCASGIARSGSLSTVVSFNDLHGNTTNFIGYPVTYGQVVLANRNGTPSDLLFNIFQDPTFTSPTDFHLQAGSPCIDAGEGSAANFDSYFPPSMGSVTNDIGAYGGAGAGRWIARPPTNTFALAVTKVPYVRVTLDPPEPGVYRLEYSSALVGADTWVQITNLPLTTVPFTYAEPATVPTRYYRAVKQ